MWNLLMGLLSFFMHGVNVVFPDILKYVQKPFRNVYSILHLKKGHWVWYMSLLSNLRLASYFGEFHPIVLIPEFLCKYECSSRFAEISSPVLGNCILCRFLKILMGWYMFKWFRNLKYTLVSAMERCLIKQNQWSNFAVWIHLYGCTTYLSNIHPYYASL